MRKGEYRAWKTKFQKIDIITRMKTVSVPYGEEKKHRNDFEK